jgi:NAD(P)-dependent dehydrogenase (short-subunit alcohol dehydrogenase family)
MDFNNRLVIVTGGTGALGSAVVTALLDAGARCRIPVIEDTPPQTFDGDKRVSFVAGCDLSDEADVARLYDGVQDLWASIHIAGGFAMSPAADTDKAALMHMLNMNLVSCHLCCRAALGAMGERGGRIVNVGARPALEPRSGAGKVAYAASKAGVVALTQALAEELAPTGTLVNAVVPAIIDTPANRAAMPDADHGQWPSPADIAATILFLASPANRVTSGAVVPVYGRA